MKTSVLAVLATLVLGTSAGWAQAQDAVKGEVTKIDEAQAKITIRHEAIKKFDMDPMTMVFRATDPASLKAIKPGDKIQFVPDKENGQFVASKIQKAK